MAVKAASPGRPNGRNGPLRDRSWTATGRTIELSLVVLAGGVTLRGGRACRASECPVSLERGVNRFLPLVPARACTPGPTAGRSRAARGTTDRGFRLASRAPNTCSDIRWRGFGYLARDRTARRTGARMSGGAPLPGGAPIARRTPLSSAGECHLRDPARLVRIEALGLRDVIGEKLSGHDRGDRRQPVGQRVRQGIDADPSDAGSRVVATHEQVDAVSGPAGGAACSVIPAQRRPEVATASTG